MSEPTDKPNVDTKPKVADTKVVETKPKVTTPPKKVKKVWANPALRMLGVPRFSLPSRNWMIFWTALASLGGGVAYDKYQQGQIREKWMKEVEHIGGTIYDTGKIPRKMTIYVAPPPNDFLVETLKHFRRFVKPVLNAAAIDFEMYSENRQGDIRQTVAKQMRDLRLAKIAEKEAEIAALKQAQYDKSWTKFFKGIPNYFQFKKNIVDEEETKKRFELYKPTDVLGLYQLFDTVEVVKEDAIDPLHAGGVICIGRGAYKEYITGIHEGLLGPLEKPQALIDDEIRVEEEKQKIIEEKLAAGKVIPEEDEDEKKKPVVKPFITPEFYAEAQLPEELDFSKIIKDENNIPVLFEQPVYVFPMPNLLGFKTIPRKIYRYYTTRFLADDCGFRASSVVNNKIREFKFKDTLMAKEEESDWPKKWVQTGKEKNSEWVQELVVDERITNRMRVYDHEL